jgi:hypothetical protein
VEFNRNPAVISGATPLVSHNRGATGPGEALAAAGVFQTNMGRNPIVFQIFGAD